MRVIPGYLRSASNFLQEQDAKSKSADKSMLENLHFVKELGLKSQSALERGDLWEFARYMDAHWQRKKERSGGVTNSQINQWYDLAKAHGAAGSKMHSTGRVGHLTFY